MLGEGKASWTSLLVISVGSPSDSRSESTTDLGELEGDEALPMGAKFETSWRSRRITVEAKKWKRKDTNTQRTTMRNVENSEAPFLWSWRFT